MARAGRIAPVLAWMGLIFLLSAQPDLSTGLGTTDYVLRKLAHMTEYGILWFLAARAFQPRNPAAGAAIAIAYAVTDEIHQHFVHGRHGAPLDVLIDATGVTIAWMATRRLGLGVRDRGTANPAS